ncbi:hypothetical protein P4639_22235 [Priestia megaterium]|uniref:hypothetical protein n=1 Tax=Priestia megaterium TaxID=1404 RepID=UPI002E250499|nr:hypothetical protein [Priestia megaterium]
MAKYGIKDVASVALIDRRTGKKVMDVSPHMITASYEPPEYNELPSGKKVKIKEEKETVPVKDIILKFMNEINKKGDWTWEDILLITAGEGLYIMRLFETAQDYFNRKEELDARRKEAMQP